MTAKNPQAIAALAKSHGLVIDPASLRFNEVGLDFLVAFAKSADGRDWVLRLPRRPDVAAKVRREARSLDLVAQRLPLAVPNWKIRADDLVAYPLLPGTPGITIDHQTGAQTWQFDKTSPLFAQSLGTALAALHGIDHGDARDHGLAVLGPAEVRARYRRDMETVRAELGVDEALWASWQAWLDDETIWPDFSVLIHGDLHVGHVMVDADGRATGILDWTEAQVGDPATDFMFHLLGFGEEGLQALLVSYRAAGGRTWPRLKDHCQAMLAAFPVQYGLYALQTRDEEHLKAARLQLGVN